MSELEKRMVYQSDFIEVFFLPGASNELLISFSAMGMYADGITMWGERPARNLGLSALGFIAKGPNWYPVVDIAKAKSAVRNVLDSFRTKIVIGGSMGGYAAVKYGRFLGAETAVAFAPQYSIDPSVHPGNRFSQFFDSSIHTGMEITANNPPPNSFVVFDPAERTDLEAFHLIQSKSPYVRPILTQYVGHETIRPFAGTQNLRSVLNFAMTGDQLGFQSFAHKMRKRPGQRSYGIALAAIERRPDISLKILERDAAEMAPRSAVHIARVLGVKILKGGDKAGARHVFEIGLSRINNDNELLRGLRAAQ